MKSPEIEFTGEMARGCAQINDECCDQMIEKAAKKVRVFEGEVYLPDDHIQLISRYSQGANLKFCFTLPEMEGEEKTSQKRRKRKKSKRWRKGNQKCRCCCRCGVNTLVNPYEHQPHYLERVDFRSSKRCDCQGDDVRERPYYYGSEANGYGCKTERKLRTHQDASCSSCETRNHRSETRVVRRKAERKRRSKASDSSEGDEERKGKTREMKKRRCTHRPASDEADSRSGGALKKDTEGENRKRSEGGDGGKVEQLDRAKHNQQRKSGGMGSSNPMPDKAGSSKSPMNSAKPTKSPSDVENVHKVYVSKKVSDLEHDEVYGKYWYHQPPADMLTECEDGTGHFKRNLAPQEVKTEGTPKDGICLGCKEPMCLVCKYFVCNCICKKPNFVICSICSHRMEQRRNKPNPKKSTICGMSGSPMLLMSMLANMAGQKQQRMACC